MSSIRSAGFVGVPGDGERVCPHCDGSGVDPAIGYQLMGGCDRCSATGVVPIAEQCRLCGADIQSAELCDKCADGNDPFSTSKFSEGRP